MTPIGPSRPLNEEPRFPIGSKSGSVPAEPGWTRRRGRPQGTEASDHPMRIFLSAGEPSGDLHAANLVRSVQALRPDVEFVGFGGPEMTKAGATKDATSCRIVAIVIESSSFFAAAPVGLGALPVVVRCA